MQRAFTAMARLVSHIGDQLISSSAVAMLELIKNSYDATSPFVHVKIDQLKRTMLVEDVGDGMTSQDLIEKFLVIGTPNRLNVPQNIERAGDKRIPLGEKGLGRFATMKLGDKLVLHTKSDGESTSNLLLVNWKQFGYYSTKRLEDIHVHLFKSKIRVSSKTSSFTKIKIYDLHDFCDPDRWTASHFEQFYKDNFMKFLNPFRPNSGFQIKLEVRTLDGELHRYTPDSIDTRLLEQAPYRIKGTIDGRQMKYEYFVRVDEGKEARGLGENVITEIDVRNLEQEGYIGQIEYEMYFYNRRDNRLKEIKGYENSATIRKLLNQYNGGLMLYRDGFRVFPYAMPGNDWLQLDSSSFAYKGMRFNTLQTIGAVHISSRENPNLRDQTNREGLVHNQAYENLTYCMRSVIRTLINQIKVHFPDPKILKGPIDGSELTTAMHPIDEGLRSLDSEIEKIQKRASDADTIHILSRVLVCSGEIRTSFGQFKILIDELERRVAEIEKERRMFLDLAGVGMIAETTAHEMRSYLSRLNAQLRSIAKSFPATAAEIGLLLNNNKALEAAVSRLDSQAITKRRSKGKVDLVGVATNLCTMKQRVWESNSLVVPLIMVEAHSHYKIRANQGMIIQVFDNLLNNAHYWLMQHQKDRVGFSPEVHINFLDGGVVEFYDNGFGIPPIDAGFIFEPFFTRRERDGGRGLGLYIVQDIMSYHDSEIYLSNDLNEYGNSFKFVLDFSKSISN